MKKNTEPHYGRKIYKLEFKEPVNGRRDYYFSSLSAIYDVFSNEEVGCKITRLWNIKISENNPYEGMLCTISEEKVVCRKRIKNQ